MRKKILDAAVDLMADFLYYERKEDEDLPVRAIERAINKGEISIDDILGKFREEIEKSCGK